MNPETPAEQPQQPQEPITSAPTTPPVETPTETPAPTPVVSTEPTPEVAQPVVASTSPEPMPPAVPITSGNKKKLFRIGGAVAAALVLLGVGYWALYLPLTPAHLYSKGLERSGEALTTLVERATAEKQLEAYTSSQLEGSFDVKMGDQTFSGTIGSKYDKKSSDSSVTYNASANQAITLKVLTSLTDKAKYPDIYFQLSGMKALGLTEFMPSLATYDGKWISVSSSYIESMVKQYGASSAPSTKIEFTANDAASLAKIAADKTSEYILTGDTKKAVFEQDKFVGKETTDGVTANRYVVTINQAHLEAACIDVANSILDSTAFKHLMGNIDDKTLADHKQSAIKDCKKKPTGSEKAAYELWINTKTKLVYKMRVSQVAEKGTYIEFGQNYAGGNSLPMFLNFHSDKEKYDGKLTLTSDIEKSTMVAHLTAKSTGEQASSVTADLSLKPYTGGVKVTPPAGAIPLEEVLKAFGLGSNQYSSTGATSPVTQARNLLHF